MSLSREDVQQRLTEGLCELNWAINSLTPQCECEKHRNEYKWVQIVLRVVRNNIQSLTYTPHRLLTPAPPVGSVEELKEKITEAHDKVEEAKSTVEGACTVESLRGLQCELEDGSEIDLCEISSEYGLVDDFISSLRSEIDSLVNDIENEAEGMISELQSRVGGGNMEAAYTANDIASGLDSGISDVTSMLEEAEEQLNSVVESLD